MQQDYILRMIQQLGTFVTGIMNLRKSGRAAEALIAIEQSYGRFSGLNATLIHAISEEDLIQLLRARGGIDPDRGWALAELLREEALSYEALGQVDEATPRFLKSMRLYLEVLDAVEELRTPVNVSGLEEVIDHVADMTLSEPTRRKLVEHFVDSARYDRAENVVLWSVEVEPVTRETLVDARDFYDRLSRVPDRELELGGLSRDEVMDGSARIAALLDDRPVLPIEA